MMATTSAERMRIIAPAGKGVNPLRAQSRGHISAVRLYEVKIRLCEIICSEGAPAGR
jgi:hypothetical protein